MCVPKMVFFFGGGEGEDVKMLCSNPMVYRMSELVQRPQKKEIKNRVVTLAIWVEVTPGVILAICGTWVDMVDVIT